LRVVWPGAVALAAGTRGLLNGRVAGVIAGWIALSLAASLLGMSRRGGAVAGAAIDLLAGLALIGATGVGSSPLWWTPLIAGVTGGLALGFLGGLGFAATGALAWMLWILAGGGAQPNMLAVGQRVAGLSLGAVLVGAAAQWLRSRPAAGSAQSAGLPHASSDSGALLRRVHDLEQERDRITETEEEARRKLARDLHDGPTQTIAAIAMRLNYARRLIERDPAAAGEEIHKLEEIARQTTREIRHMLFTLRPLVLESRGLVPALRQLAAKVAETHDQQVIVEAEPDSDRGLDTRAQAVAFFIAEEAINNARKHAESEHVWVRVRREADDRFILEVEDDGVGFNVGAVDAHYEQRGSLGMVNMRERAELIRAALHLESAEGKGTRIVLDVPLQTPQQARPGPG
jgi:signal transduction histidine kinase